MNVQRGDMAVIIRCAPGQEASLGHFCTIVEYEASPITGAPGWRFEPRTRDGFTCALDEVLQPIRPRGAGSNRPAAQPLDVHA